MTPQPQSDNAAAGLSEVGRITGVYLDPKKAFADIAARPRNWFVPLLLLIVASLAFLYIYGKRVPDGWERTMRQNMESSTRMQQMDPQQRENIIQQQVKFAPIGAYVSVVVFIPVAALAIGGVLLLMAKMAGAQLTFKQMFTISAYSMLPGLISSILAIVVLLLKNPEDFNLQNPLAFNLAAFLEPPPNTGRFVYGVAKSFDLFSIWTILLLAVGMSVAARKISFSKAVMLVVIPWLVWVLASSGVAGAFG
jgi:hypothetical protein